MTSDLQLEPLHRVTKEELPILLEWTSKHLPDAYKIYRSVLEELNGRWLGPTYYTLGWPNILAVGEGPVDESLCKCAEFFNHVRHTCVYSPNNEHVEELLMRPQFLDWTKPILFHVHFENANVVERISNTTGTKYNKRVSCNLMAAFPGEVTPRPVPEGFELRPLDSELDSEYVTTTWPYRRKYTQPYLSEVFKIFPSVGIFNSNGECVACEVGTEYGFAGLLYVRDDYRGRGLASCVVSQIAQKYFEENQPVLSTVVPSNKPAIDMHQKLGLKAIGRLCWFVHTMNAEKVFLSFLGDF